MMSSHKQLTALALAMILASVAVVAASSDSEGASGDTARVFIGDGTDSGTTEYSGTGTTVKAVLSDALAGNSIVFNANGTVQSLGGMTNSATHSWVIYQWQPPTGWVSVNANNAGDAYLEDGTSYYVFYAESTEDGSSTTYSTPSSFEPTATAYFFIKFVTDSNANSYVTSVLTEEERLNGFWISGTGSDVAAAFKDACSSLRALGNSGFELVMNDDRTHYLYGWLGSFMGLGDEALDGGLWNNWSQFRWVDSTGSWVYNQRCLGYYDPGVTPYFSLVRQITEENKASAGVTATPSSIPSSVISGTCTVTFVDGDGNVMKTQSVSYFGSATAPSNPTKAPSGGVTYTFTGWDRDFDQVTSNITVTAQFSASSSGGPEGGGSGEGGGGSEGGGSGEGSTVPVTSVSLSYDTTGLTAGRTYGFTATVLPTNATDKGVTWATSNSSVATVDQSGNVTAVSNGSATITVTTSDGGFKASVVVTVTGASQSIALSHSFAALLCGDHITIIEDVTGSGDVTWSSSDPSVATVEDGFVTAVASGSAVITASLGDLVASCKIVVVSEDNVDEMTSVDLSGTSDSFNISSAWCEALVEADSGLTVTADAWVMEMPSSVVGTIGESTVRGEVVSVNDLQSSLVGDSTLYNFTVTAGSGSVSELGGTVSVSIPYTPPSGSDASDVRVYCIDIYGNILEEMPCTYSDGWVTFRTTHFSTFFATTESLAVTGQTTGGDDDGSSTMLYVGIAVVAIAAIAAVAALVVRGRH